MNSLNSPTAHKNAHVAIVGAGPRGSSVLERLVAYSPDLVTPDMHLTVHVVDPFPPGPGSVWRVDQSKELLMNTVTSQITLFTDQSVTSAGRICPGPTLYQWLADRNTELGPNDYATRALYGEYLGWFFEEVVRHAPKNVTVQVHGTRAVALEDGPGGLQKLRLADGSQVKGLSSVVLANGHLPLRPTTAEKSLASFAQEHQLHYVPPVNPADMDLSAIPAGDTVFLRGLGLNFFDYMALLTSGRGGRFERTNSGELRYHSSGAEPQLYAASRRGIPYQARGDNEKGPHERHYSVLLTDEVIAGFRRRAAEGKNPPDFEQQVWPLVKKEVELVYYEALLGVTDCDKFRAEFLACAPESQSETQLLERYGIQTEQRWNWERIVTPYAGKDFATAADWHQWLVSYLKDDVQHARRGNIHGPVKAALDILRDLRNEVRLIVDHGGLAGASRRDHLDKWYTPLNGYLSIGPPRERIEQMIALMEAGVLTVIGPLPAVQCDVGSRTWRVRSPLIPGSEVLGVNTLIEARLPEPDLGHTADELLSNLLQAGQCRAHACDGYVTGGIDVTESPFYLIDCQGRAHPRRFAVGVPTEGVHWVTAAGARPGVNSVTLCDTDAISRAALVAVSQDMRTATDTSASSSFYTSTRPMTIAS